MPRKQYYVYILASQRNGTLYVGVTSDLVKKIYQHKNDLAEGFTKRCRVHDLVYYETSDDVYAAIAREKQMKEWERSRKVELIEQSNPLWEDRYPQLG